jgi:hypothetical protein
VIEPEWAQSLINYSQTDGNVYMMEELDTKVTHEFIKNSRHFEKGRLVNVLHDDIGINNKTTLIWQFDSLDDTRGLSRDNGIIGKSVVMLPAPWSPMK